MIKLYNQDCLSAMANFKDNEFDLAIVDPPYGIGKDGQRLYICKNPKHNRKEHTQKDWDKRPDHFYFGQLLRVSRDLIVWGANYFVEYLKPSKGWIFWYKGQQGLTMSDGELAYSSFPTPTRSVCFNRVELLKEGTIHPTQKPVKLYEWLLTNYAQVGDKILDTHGGSMSIALACHNMGFDLTLYEIDKDYFKAGKARLEEHQKQARLFV